MTRTFKCALCKEEFDQGWSEEEAETELAQNFPGWEKDECVIVCDDCYKKMFA